MTSHGMTFAVFDPLGSGQRSHSHSKGDNFRKRWTSGHGMMGVIFESATMSPSLPTPVSPESTPHDVCMHPPLFKCILREQHCRQKNDTVAVAWTTGESGGGCTVSTNNMPANCCHSQWSMTYLVVGIKSRNDKLSSNKDTRNKKTCFQHCTAH